MGFQKFTPRLGNSRGGRGGFRGGRGGGKFNHFDSGPPEEVIEVGSLLHPCQEDLVCKLITEKIPYSNAPVYLQNKEEIGKVDEIFGPIKDAFYMDPARFMPLERALNPNPTRGRGGRGRGDSRGRFGSNSTPGRGRSDFRGRWTNRGDSRGGFRGGRGNFNGNRGRGDTRGNWGRGDRNSFRGKREFNDSSNASPQVKKFKSED